MTLHKIKETVYNTYGWRLSDREEQVIKHTQKGEQLKMSKWRLSEREEFLMRMVEQ